MNDQADPGPGLRNRAAQRKPAPEAAPGGTFRDGKHADALRTIGEVAHALGLRQHVLRYWEEQFPMLRPLTRAGGRRYYRPEDIALLRRINALVHGQGYTIRGARLALMVPAVVDDVSDISAPEMTIVDAMAVLRGHLDAIRSRLAGALADS